MSERVYLDWNATAPMRVQARAAMAEALGLCGNPSSVHAEGRAARGLIEQAREHVAALVGGQARNVVFTSGGTEANMLALSPATALHGNAQPRERLMVSAIEHPSVLTGGRFPAGAVEKLPVASDGIVDLAALRERLSNPSAGGVLVSVMLANNETGVVQPISEVAALVHDAGGLLHVDAVQAAGRIACDINMLGADLLTLSAHKIGGPKGAGALVKRDEGLHLDSLLKGGGQERGARAGTENVAAIAGFGAAAAAAYSALAAEGARVALLRDRLEAEIKAATPDAIIFGAGVQRVPNTTLVARTGMKAETAVIAFDLKGIAVSSGAACSSGKVQPSHVLAAMGVSAELARAAIRVSLGPDTADSDIKRFLSAWIKVSRVLLKDTKGMAA